MQDIIAEHVANAHREAASSPLLAVQTARKAADAIAHDAFLRRGGRGVPPTTDAIVRSLTDKGACTAEVAKAFELVTQAAVNAQRVAPGPDAIAPTLTALRSIAAWYWGDVLKADAPPNVKHLLHPTKSIAEDDEDQGGTLVMRSKPAPAPAPAPKRDQHTMMMDVRDNVQGFTEHAAPKITRPAAPPRPAYVAPPPPPMPMPMPAPAPEKSNVPLFVGIGMAVLVVVLAVVLVAM